MRSAVHHHRLVLSSTLINARLKLSIPGVRLFTALLAQIRSDAQKFEEICLPARDFLTPSARIASNKDYHSLTRLLTHFQGEVLQLPPAETAGSAAPWLPLLAHGYHEKGPGRLYVKLADVLQPHLLQQTVNFTCAPHAQVRKLKTPVAFRLYWLLKEYADLGVRTLDLTQLKWVLNLSDSYRNVTLFVTQVLERARQELADTDLAFTMEPVKTGKRIQAVRFFLRLPDARLVTAQPSPVNWPDSAAGELLRNLGTVMWLLGGWALAFIVSTWLTANG